MPSAGVQFINTNSTLRSFLSVHDCKSGGKKSNKNKFKPKRAQRGATVWGQQEDTEPISATNFPLSPRRFRMRCIPKQRDGEHTGAHGAFRDCCGKRLGGRGATALPRLPRYWHPMRSAWRRSISVFANPSLFWF